MLWAIPARKAGRLLLAVQKYLPDVLDVKSSSPAGLFVGDQAAGIDCHMERSQGGYIPHCAASAVDPVSAAQWMEIEFPACASWGSLCAGRLIPDKVPAKSAGPFRTAVTRATRGTPVYTFGADEELY